MKIETFTISEDFINEVRIQMYGSLEAAKIAEEQEVKRWCNGHKKHYTSYYVKDKPSMKHHWRCVSCKKITQIG